MVVTKERDELKVKDSQTLSKAKNRIKELENRIETMTLEQKALQDANRWKTLAINNTHSYLENARCKIDELQTKLVVVTNERDELKAKDSQTANTQDQSEFSTLHLENNRLHEQIKRLQTVIEKITKDRNELQATEWKQKLEAWGGPVSSQYFVKI